jgi:hypothetical protein
VSQPERPRLLAFLVAQAAIPTPSGGLNIIELCSGIATADFPNDLPPFSVIAILIGGRPGTVYSTKFQFLDPKGKIVGEVHGHDVPFTTQIKRVNVIQNLSEIIQGQKIEKPGTFTIRLLVNGHVVGDTDLEIQKLPSSPQPSPPENR